MEHVQFNWPTATFLHELVSEYFSRVLPLKRQVKFVGDRILNFFYCFSEKISLDISCESSAWQMIHMNYQDLFSEKKKKKNQSVACRSCDCHFKD